MSPLITFIVLFICFILIRHLYQAFKRIKALEERVTNLEKGLSDTLDQMSTMTEIMQRNNDLLDGHDKELLVMRSKFRSIK